MTTELPPTNHILNESNEAAGAAVTQSFTRNILDRGIQEILDMSLIGSNLGAATMIRRPSRMLSKDEARGLKEIGECEELEGSALGPLNTRIGSFSKASSLRFKKIDETHHSKNEEETMPDGPARKRASVAGIIGRHSKNDEAMSLNDIAKLLNEFDGEFSDSDGEQLKQTTGSWTKLNGRKSGLAVSPTKSKPNLSEILDRIPSISCPSSAEGKGWNPMEDTEDSPRNMLPTITRRSTRILGRDDAHALKEIGEAEVLETYALENVEGRRASLIRTTSHGPTANSHNELSAHDGARERGSMISVTKKRASVACVVGRESGVNQEMNLNDVAKLLQDMADELSDSEGDNDNTHLPHPFQTWSKTKENNPVSPDKSRIEICQRFDRLPSMSSLSERDADLAALETDEGSSINQQGSEEGAGSKRRSHRRSGRISTGLKKLFFDYNKPNASVDTDMGSAILSTGSSRLTASSRVTGEKVIDKNKTPEKGVEWARPLSLVELQAQQRKAEEMIARLQRKDFLSEREQKKLMQECKGLVPGTGEKKHKKKKKTKKTEKKGKAKAKKGKSDGQ